MGSQVEIRDIAALKSLRTSLRKYSTQSLALIENIENQIKRDVAHLKSIEKELQFALERKRKELEDAKYEYRMCLESGSSSEDDEDEDCSSEERWVNIAEDEFDKAFEKLKDCRRIIQRVDASISRFRKETTKIRTLSMDHTLKGIEALRQLINGAEDYLFVSSPSSTIADNTNSIRNENAAPHGPSHSISRMITNAAAKNGDEFQILVEPAGERAFIYVVKDGKAITNGPSSGNFRVESKGNQKRLRIGDIILPEKYRGLHIGGQMLACIEKTAEENGCMEIYGWADNSVKGFYEKKGYETRNNIPNSGAEIYKTCKKNSNDSESMKAHFKGLNEKIANGKMTLGPPKRIHDINPDRILPPDTNEKFWSHHGNSKESYQRLARDFQNAVKAISSGVDEDLLESENPNAANALKSFQNNPIRLIKLGDYYMVDEDGRHRVAAVQSLPTKASLTAEVREAIPVVK